MPKSLMEYAQDRRRQDCPVCALPDEIREAMRSAREKRITRGVVLDWLRDEHNIELDDATVTSHSNGRHEPY